MPPPLNPELAVKAMKEAWPDYDFSKFVYKGQHEKSIVICKEHGEILRARKSIMRVGGIPCPYCSSSLKKNTEIFLQELKEKFKERYDLCDYSTVEYESANKPVKIICKKHGEFTKNPGTLLFNDREYICSTCNYERRSDQQRYTLERFLEVVPRNKFELDDFSKSTYISSKDTIEIECKTHGPYLTRPNTYLNGSRCKRCDEGPISNPESDLFKFIKTIKQDAINRIRPVKNLSMELDVFIPSMNIGVEFNGLFFHRCSCEPADKFSGKMASKRTLLEKTERFLEHNIRVIHIFEDEWNKKQSIVKTRLRSILDSDERVFARKCRILELSPATVKELEESLHIQGHSKSASYRYGLEYGGEIVASMTFSGLRFEKGSATEFELLRFCSTKSVVGGFSKLLKYFIRTVSPTRIVSYSDRRWSLGNVYSVNGFKKTKVSDPGYFWFKNKQRFNRVLFQRHKLDELFKEKFSEEMTESDIMYSKGYMKIFDCGQDKWELRLK